MKRIAAVFPDVHSKHAGVDGALVGFAEATQVGFVEIGQGADGFERRFRRNVKIVGRFIAKHNGDAAARLDPAAQGMAQGTGQVEIGRQQHQFMACLHD